MSGASLKTEGGDGAQVVCSALEDSQIKPEIPWPQQLGVGRQTFRWGDHTGTGRKTDFGSVPT